MALSKIENTSLNTGVPGKSNLPSGSVLQVVTGTYSTTTTTSSSSPVTTGLTATITPTSATSKVFVVVSETVRKAGGASGCDLILYRASSPIYYPMYNMGYSSGTTNTTTLNGSFSYLDSPATTSSTAYTVYFLVNSGSTGTVQVDDAKATITLMEIAA